MDYDILQDDSDVCLCWDMFQGMNICKLENFVSFFHLGSSVHW